MRKPKHPFDTKGGFTITSQRLLKHPNYLSLSPQSKVLMSLMQVHWREDRYVDYGVREASEKIPCDRKTTMKAFNQLQEKGFITLMEEAWFSGRTDSKSRRWKLEWMPFNWVKPSNKWEKLERD